MSRVLIVAHRQRSEAAALARVAASWLHQHGHEAWMLRDDADALELGELAADRAPGEADLVLSLGGDGTMLRAVQLLDGRAAPVIGVNVGLLGYLTEVEPQSMTAALERFTSGPDADQGDWHVERRMMVDAVVHHVDGTPEQSFRALNEGVLEKLEPGHTVRMMVRIDGAPFTSYAADGLIVATPTGSTAYSLSARGPVVSPRHRALLLTPVSPHMLFDRSLVLDPEEVVEIEVVGHRTAVLSIDGMQTASLVEGDTVTFRASPAEAHFVRFGRRRFHQILKAKFGLSDR
ncbi:MAG: NAD(+)/NADH kinase [Acidimicrobiales bacterium]